MAGRPTKLTPEVQQRIVAYIRQGAFAWIAAEASGIGKTTFYRWMADGEKASRGRYHEFYRAVRQAQAEARVTAEVEVKRIKPDTWLRSGPGRDRPGEPGWTDRQEIVDRRPQMPRTITFDIRKASGGIVPPRDRPGWKPPTAAKDEASEAS